MHEGAANVSNAKRGHLSVSKRRRGEFASSEIITFEKGGRRNRNDGDKDHVRICLNSRVRREGHPEVKEGLQRIT